LNHTDQDPVRAFKECAGKGCKNIARHKLKIKYIQKIGYFCDSCKDDLLYEELALKEDDISVCNRGSSTSTGVSALNLKWQ
jgi:hypothetical protein